MVLGLEARALLRNMHCAVEPQPPPESLRLGVSVSGVYLVTLPYSNVLCPLFQLSWMMKGFLRRRWMSGDGRTLLTNICATWRKPRGKVHIPPSTLEISRGRGCGLGDQKRYRRDSNSRVVRVAG